MIVPSSLPAHSDIIYPESDGEPMSDNTRQLSWIVMLYGNLAALCRDDPNVFVGGNQFWFPVAGEPELRQAPDVYVVFGRPKGHRPSYKQWEENNVPMTVTFEILSPRNRPLEMVDKLLFYEDYGVQEYYIYDPDEDGLVVYLRKNELLRPQRQANSFTSPRLGIRFDLSGPEMVVYHPSGCRFLTFEDLEAERVAIEARVQQAQLELDQLQRDAKQQLARFSELSRRARSGQSRGPCRTGTTRTKAGPLTSPSIRRFSEPSTAISSLS